MRLLLGIIVGAFLTVGGACVYDSHNAQSASNTTGTAAAGELGRGQHQVGSPDGARPRRVDPPRGLTPAPRAALMVSRRFIRIPSSPLSEAGNALLDVLRA